MATDGETGVPRRSLLIGAAALTGCTLFPAGTRAARAGDDPVDMSREREAMDMIYAPPGRGVVTGKGVGDFDFLTGEWRIRHRRLVDKAAGKWEDSESGATVHRVLDGMGSVEELRKPDGSYLGMGVRMWLPQSGEWADHWTSAANGIVNAPQLGRFIDGEGIFLSRETVDGVEWLYRGVWDKIADGTCRWHQSASRDNGVTWEWNWWMEWTRTG